MLDNGSVTGTRGDKKPHPGGGRASECWHPCWGPCFCPTSVAVPSAQRRPVVGGDGQSTPCIQVGAPPASSLFRVIQLKDGVEVNAVGSARSSI